MALIAPLHTLIELPVSDRVLADTRIKQRACFLRLEHIQQPGTGLSTARIQVLVTSYADDGGDFGPSLSGPGIVPYEVALLADNNALVSFPDGAIVAVRNPHQLPAEWQGLIQQLAAERDVMLQGDYFEWLRENAPIKIGDMIRLHIQQADAMGRFA